MVGQRFVQLLADHPWFHLREVAASPRSVGRRYEDAVEWLLPQPLPPTVGKLHVKSADEELQSPLVFSALDAAVAGEIEEEYARRGHLVVSNARSHRMAPGVPLLVPEVNPDHLDLLSPPTHRGGRGSDDTEHPAHGAAGIEWRTAAPPGPTSGGIITNPNCSTIILALALAPLHRAFGVRKVSVVTLQSLSGAGRPGLAALDVQDNVIPHIRGEEEKIQTETLKILGRVAEGEIRPARIPVSAQCTRVPVLDGHTLCVSVALEGGGAGEAVGKNLPAPDGRSDDAGIHHGRSGDIRAEDIRRAWTGFRGEPQRLALPSAPSHPVLHHPGQDHPQPRLHRDRDGGMACSVGRLRPCPVLGWRFVAVGHNTLRGAAGGAVLCAELAVARRLLG